MGRLHQAGPLPERAPRRVRRARRRLPADGLPARLQPSPRTCSRTSAGQQHTLQFRADILNFGNLLNKRLGRRPAAPPQPAADLARRGLAGPGDIPAAGHQRPAADEVSRVDGRPVATSTACSSACATASTRTLQSNGRRAGGGSNGRAGLPRSAVRLFGGAHSRAASGGRGVRRRTPQDMQTMQNPGSFARAASFVGVMPAGPEAGAGSGRPGAWDRIGAADGAPRQGKPGGHEGHEI